LYREWLAKGHPSFGYGRDRNIKIKRHGRVSALKCMRETDRVSLREPASCEHLRLSDLNNDSAD